MNKRLKGTYQTQNTNFASNPSTTPFKVNGFFGVNIEPTNKSKGIQCRECEGYGHIHAECANTRKKNKSYTMTWSNEESEEREEPSREVMVFVSLATTKDPLASAASHSASFLMADAESSDDEEISNEEMVYSYRVMNEKLVKALNENYDLRKQVFQLCNEKEDLVKQNNMLRDKVCPQNEFLHELEQMKKSVHMLNSRTMTLDRILKMGKRTKDLGGHGFKGENSRTNSLTEETQKVKITITGRRHLYQHSGVITVKIQDTSRRNVLTS